MDFTPPYGAWEKERRRQLDLTQEELARKAHYSTVAIHRVETGNLRPSREMAEALAEALDVPAGDRSSFVSFARGVASRRQTDNLPLPLTPLVGRETELAELRAHLGQPGTRLITLLGPPGVGKTRLAIATAREVLADFEDGVCFIGLAPLGSSGEVAGAIFAGLSEFLGVRITDRSSAMRGLRDRRLLLVLDNFEHVLEAAPEVTKLLGAEPRMSVLVTSRAILNVSGERVYEVNPLQLPMGRHLRSPARVLHSPAVALFVQRAQAAKQSFALTPANTSAVVALCRKLDGVPLALELAAARIRMFTPETLLEKLEAHLGLALLAGGARDLPERQRALRNALEWSFGLLSAGEQRLFTRLGVFPGSFTPEAADEICGLGIVEPLDALASLLDKSLLEEAHEAPGQTRLTMLVFAREFASERLEANPDGADVHRRHAIYYLDVAQRMKPYDTRVDIDVPLQSKLVDFHNVRAAALWCAARPAEYLTGLQLLSNASYLGSNAPQHPWLRFRPEEYREMVAKVFEVSKHLPTPDRIDLLTSLLGEINVVSPEGADQVETEILNTGTAFHRARVGMQRSARAGCAHHPEEAIAHARLALEAAEAHGDPVLIASMMSWLGTQCETFGEYDEALPILERALTLWTRLNIRDYTYGGIDTARNQLARVLVALGQADEALTLTSSALPYFETMGDMLSLSLAHRTAGRARVLRGEPNLAVCEFRTCLDILHDAEIEGTGAGIVAATVIDLAGALIDLDQPERAARMLGAFASRFSGAVTDANWVHGWEISNTFWPQAQSWIDAHPEFLPHWKEGEKMTYTRVIEYALEE